MYVTVSAVLSHVSLQILTQVAGTVKKWYRNGLSKYLTCACAKL